jgi:hypothetical protein
MRAREPPNDEAGKDGNPQPHQHNPDQISHQSLAFTEAGLTLAKKEFVSRKGSANKRFQNPGGAKGED